jgi:hypothetical protein
MTIFAVVYTKDCSSRELFKKVLYSPLTSKSDYKIECEKMPLSDKHKR